VPYDPPSKKTPFTCAAPHSFCFLRFVPDGGVLNLAWPHAFPLLQAWETMGFNGILWGSIEKHNKKLCEVFFTSYGVFFIFSPKG
jgi:hypothetical protein